MKKSHGPAFRQPVIELVQCPHCWGRAVIRGIFFREMPCNGCNASGWVHAETLEALPLQTLVTQLSLRLRKAEHQVALIKPTGKATGPAAQYQGTNRRGAGGSNFTGD
jgi:hypothetical protein